MPLLPPADPNGTKRGGRRRQTADDMMRLQPQKRFPLTENVCEGCDRLKKRTHWNEPLYAFYCSEPECKEKEKEQAKIERRKLREQEAADSLKAEREAAAYDRTFDEEEVA